MLKQEYLKKVFEYNPETGILKWKKRLDTTDTINTKYSGKEAGFKSKNGYIRIGINGKTYAAHTIAYCIHFGKWVDQIDHENHIRNDNRILNMKPCSMMENEKNKKLFKTNTTGHCGVYARKNRFRAIIVSDNKRIHLGYFDNIDDAVKARKKAEKEHGFHPNHGT